MRLTKWPAWGGGWRELLLVIGGHVLLTIFMTAPLSTRFGSVARLDNADTRLIIWNVAWVARTLVIDPLHVFDANIFYPHRGTLAYSESNLGAGLLAIPVYWITRNPYAAHNFVVLLSFVIAGVSTYYLVRHLVRDRRAAALSSVCFSYLPYTFSHLPHVHLLMTASLPLAMLAFHRVVESATVGRGLILGLALGASALFCGYYALFGVLMVGFSVVAVAAMQGRWRDRRYWMAIGVAAVAANAIALPLFVPYLRLQRDTGFSRSLEEARLWSASWRSYLASSSHAHGWLLSIIRRWVEVLFPGFIASIAGVAGVGVGLRAGGRLRQLSLLYAGIGLLAFWGSLGPAAGLYGLLYRSVPAFNFLHAPSRFGVVVGFALCVLAGMAVAALLAATGRGSHARRAHVVGALLVVAAILELKVPLSFSPVPPVEPAYRLLATLPPGPVIELPFYSHRFATARTQYMLSSTVHWMPLVNGYSSYIPKEFHENTPILGQFPSRESFALLERDRVRYAVFHLDLFNPEARRDVLTRLGEFDRYLARHYADDRVWLFEIVAFPQGDSTGPSQ